MNITLDTAVQSASEVQTERQKQKHCLENRICPTCGEPNSSQWQELRRPWWGGKPRLVDVSGVDEWHPWETLHCPQGHEFDHIF